MIQVTCIYVKIPLQVTGQTIPKKVTLKDMQSITCISLLNFACSVVVPGRTFLRRLINLTCGLTNLKFYIRLNKESRADLETWAMFIDHYNGKSVYLDSAWLSSDLLSLYSGASGSLGFAAVLGSQ